MSGPHAKQVSHQSNYSLIDELVTVSPTRNPGGRVMFLDTVAAGWSMSVGGRPQADLLPMPMLDCQTVVRLRPFSFDA